MKWMYKYLVLYKWINKRKMHAALKTAIVCEICNFKSVYTYNLLEIPNVLKSFLFSKFHLD